MYTVLIVVHALVTIALIGIILVQRNAGDGMGLSGSSSNSFMSGRSAATFVTRATAILAAIFILLSLAIGIVTAHTRGNSNSLIDKITNQPAVESPANAIKQEPAKPAVPRPE